MLATATKSEVTTESLVQVTEKLCKAIDVMHGEVAAFEITSVATREVKEHGKSGEHRFQIGDLVLIMVSGNAQHVARRHKAVTTWQGPYEVVMTRNVTTLGVRMVGSTDEPKFVHWSKVKRFCGADVDLPVEVAEQA